MKQDLNHKTIIISRTDSIGDVLLTLPICAWIKATFPQAKLLFLGKGYTRSVVEAYDKVDRFIDWNEVANKSKAEQAEWLQSWNAEVIVHVFPQKAIARAAKKAGIPMRIGTSHRGFHLFTCTHRLNFTRKQSDLHEAQLNHELLRPLGLTALPSLEEVIEQTAHFKVPEVSLPTEFSALKNATILHPKSQGSAREWPMKSYVRVAESLIKQGKTVVFTGTEGEGAQFRDQLPSECIDTTGKLSLEQLMVLIANADNLVACSTGPLHIAGFLNIHAIGLFSPRRPIHPGRWRALGKRVSILVKDEQCANCAQKKPCDCISEISVEAVLDKIA